MDEINAFLLENHMLIYLVVFDEKAHNLGRRLFPDLEEYIDQNYVDEKCRVEESVSEYARLRERLLRREVNQNVAKQSEKKKGLFSEKRRKQVDYNRLDESSAEELCDEDSIDEASTYDDSILKLESELEEKMQHISDTFSQYLIYLIKEKNMENAEVYKRALVDKKTFSKIKNNVDYHPQKLTALCLCVGAHLNLDETKDLLARAGYALSPSDKTDIIFSYFIENEIYDMIELDIQLGAHGLPCVIP